MHVEGGTNSRQEGARRLMFDNVLQSRTIRYVDELTAIGQGT